MTSLLHSTHAQAELEPTAAEHTPIQLLTPQGELVESQENAPYRDLVAHLDADVLRGMYRDMMFVRRFDNEATSLQRQGELALYAPLRGQEAAQIGSGLAMRPTDMVFPSYREHGVAYTRGMDIVEILQLFRGVDHGGWDSFKHNFHLYTLVIGSHALHATGYAMGFQRDADLGIGEGDEAVIAYFGDGATSQGDVSEALGFAAVNNAPIVFFVQNNQWAISVPTHKQTKVPLYLRGEGFGVPGIRVDGNDVLACYAATTIALNRARAGQGPTLIEAVTYRMGAHTTSDDPTKYRSREEEAEWEAKDPIDRLRALLDSQNAWSEADEEALAVELDSYGEHVRNYVKSLGRPSATSMFENVYATDHAIVSEDRAWFERYESSFLDSEQGPNR